MRRCASSISTRPAATSRRPPTGCTPHRQPDRRPARHHRAPTSPATSTRVSDPCQCRRSPRPRSRVGGAARRQRKDDLQQAQLSVWGVQRGRAGRGDRVPSVSGPAPPAHARRGDGVLDTAGVHTAARPHRAATLEGPRDLAGHLPPWMRSISPRQGFSSPTVPAIPFAHRSSSMAAENQAATKPSQLG